MIKMKIELSKIAQLVGGKIEGDDRIIIRGINSLDCAIPGEISFLTALRYKKKLATTLASAIIIAEPAKDYKGSQIIVANPELAYAKTAQIFAMPLTRFNGISPQSIIDETCFIGKDVSIFPNVYLGKNISIGDGTILFPGVYIGDRVKIGDKSVIHANVSILEDCIIGNNVIICSGSVIGSDGFGFVKDGDKSVRIPQIGTVQIDDDVEIGANNCVDKAALGKTWIKRGVKTDNLVHIAHNVVVGEDSILVAQVGVSGSVRIGKQVILGGQAGISDHIDIGDKAMIGSQSGIAKTVLPGNVVSGTPGMPHRLYLKTSSLITRLPHLFERLGTLEKKIAKLGQTDRQNPE